MECYVKIISEGQVLTPVSLVQKALSSTALPLTLLGNNNQEITINFKHAKDVFVPAIQNSPSTSSMVSHCHFDGFNGVFHSAISLCHPEHIAGIISTNVNFFILEARNETSFVLLSQTVKNCELTGRIKRQAEDRTLPNYYSKFNDGKSRYVELALVADNSVFEKYGKDEAKVNDRLQSIAHLVNSLYYPLNIRITLVWVDIWKDGDIFEVATIGDKTLDLFLNYRKKFIKEHPNDNAHMLTNVRFEAGVVGKAFKGTMCSYDYSGGVDVDHSANAASVAATIAHEMGHNFGMEHDVEYGTICNCPVNHCIMAPSTGTPPPSFWSDCSLKYLSNSFNRGVDLCLKNPPEKSVGNAKCGNGIVEPGEECDCGREQCIHNCCDGKTCRLTSDAECADGDCCDYITCKPKPRATECRASTGLCDLAEYCNGETSDCPADFFVQNGHICPDKQNEFCFEGQCGSRPDQCKAVWGSSSQEAVFGCYQLNKHGVIQGNCGFDVHSQNYTACLPDNVMCGRLQCETEAERPIFGDPSTVTTAYSFIRDGFETHKCQVIKTTYVGNAKNKLDPGMVLDGAQCGNEKICVDARCRSISEVTKTVSKCNDRCHDRGLCNNVGNCHCENGFGGIACEIPGYGGSVNSNIANTSRGLTPSLFFLILFGIFAIIMVAICLYFWFRKRRNLVAEFWAYIRKALKLQGVLVPVRKAPPPPGGRRRTKRESLNAMWGEGTVSYSVNDRPPQFVLPAIPLMSISPASSSNSYISSALHSAPRVEISHQVSLRPKEPPPLVPSRPRESKLEQLYDERGEEMGIKRNEQDTLEESKKKSEEQITTKLDKSDQQMRHEKARPPLPKHMKPGQMRSGDTKPALPKKPPKAIDPNISEGKIDVRGLAAKFDN